MFLGAGVHFLFLLLMATAVEGFSATCVVDFDLPTQSTSEFRQFLLEGEQTKYLSGAFPKDLTSCIREGYEEILFLAHTSKHPKTGKVVFNYFKELNVDQKSGALRAELSKVKEAKQKLQEQLDGLLERVEGRNPCLNSHKPPCTEVRVLQSTLRSFEEYEQHLEDFPQDQELFHLNNFGPLYFHYLREEMALLKENNSLALKKLRMSSCDIESAFETYPDLELLITENNIELDVASPSWLGSQLKGVEKGRLLIDIPWLLNWW